MKAVSYAHITPEEAKAGRPSISEQQAAINAWAKEEGIQVVLAHHDDPVSISKSRPEDVQCSRAGAMELLDSAPSGGWLYVLATAPDRLERPDAGMSIREELLKMGKRVAFVGQRLELPPQRKAPAKKPRERRVLTLAERLLKGREDAARMGLHQSGPAPYGYRRNYQHSSSMATKLGEPRVLLEIHPEEAEVVKSIFRQYLRRKSMLRLIRWLNSEGYRTRRGKEWSRAGVAWILKNTTYLGRVRFGRIRARGQHPAIISAITFNKVQKLLAKNNKRGGRPKGLGNGGRR